jgi:RecB family endonuclease NucS
VRLVVARCSVEYEGRLGARLPPAQRLILLKADGSIAVHADSKAYKPLNWMSPPCTIREEPGAIVATNPGGERLTIALHEVLLEHDITLATTPALPKTASRPSCRSSSPRACAPFVTTSASCGVNTRPILGRSICCAGTARAARW